MKKLLAIIDAFTNDGTLSSDQSSALKNLTNNTRIPLYLEIRLMLYGGVAFFLAGLALTIKEYFLQMGHVSIITLLSLGFVASIVYCERKGPAFSVKQTTPPHIAFDYVLYLGCTFLSLLITYIETHFQLFGQHWNHYLLGTSLLFFFFAYRFDNKFVLSLALGTLAAWFGFSMKNFGFIFENNFREVAIGFGVAAGGMGLLTYRLQIKSHFLNIFLNFSLHFSFIGLVFGVSLFPFSLYTLGLAVLTPAVVHFSLKYRKFLYFLYGIVYGYIGLTSILTGYLFKDELIVYSYLILSSIALVVLLFRISKRFKDES